MVFNIRIYNDIKKIISSLSDGEEPSMNMNRFWQLLYECGVMSVFFLSFSGTTVLVFQSYLVFVLILPFFLIKRKLPKNIPIFIIVILAIMCIYYIKIGNLDFYLYMIYISKLLISFLTVFLIGKVFIRRMLQMVYGLCLISIPFYFLQLTMPDLLSTTVGLFSNIIEPMQVNYFNEGYYHNIFFYTVSQRQIFRNSGFMWEPSALGVVVVVCFILNTYRTKKLLHKYNFGYILAIATSLSSTAIGGITVFLIAYSMLAFKKNVGLGVVIFAAMILLGLRIATLPIMEEKIISQIESVGPQIQKNLSLERGGQRYNTRFAGIVIDLPRVLENPIIGLGFDHAVNSKKFSRYTHFSKEWQRIGSTTSLLLRIGFIGCALFFYTLYKAAQLYTKDVYLSTVFVGMLILLSVSNILVESTFTFSIMMYWFYVRKGNSRPVLRNWIKSITLFTLRDSKKIIRFS